MSYVRRQASAVFSAREVIAAGELFRPWDRGFHDAGVALDELASLEPREPTVLRVTRGVGRPRGGPWTDVVGDWLCESGEAPRRLPRPRWGYDENARAWCSGREWLEAWELCENARWMLHAAATVGVDRRLVVLAACDCARTSLRHVPAGEARPLRAIETAEAWARGEATAEQARTAAYAAYDAAEAAAYAAEAAAEAAADAAAAGGVGGAWAAAMRGALRDLAAVVRSRIPTLDVLRAAASPGGGR